MFDAGNGFCEKCSSDCFRCQGSPTTCVACKFKGALPNLLGNVCVDVCPADYTEKGGLCTLCESPCSTCKISPNFCTSCEPNKLLFGPTCVDTCPNGTKKSKRDGVDVCEGCLSGCTTCDVTDPRVCNICNTGLMVHEGDCVNDCPPGFLANFRKTECLS
jgi:proprotein convertase subtilisin/kexin type 5